MSSESHYKEKLEHRCCKDGLREIPMPYSCTRRSFYITEGWECIRAFRYCCATYRDQLFNTEVPTDPPPSTPPTSTPRPNTPPPPTTRRPPRPTSPFRFHSMDLHLQRGDRFCTSTLSLLKMLWNVALWCSTCSLHISSVFRIQDEMLNIPVRLKVFCTSYQLPVDVSRCWWPPADGGDITWVVGLQMWTSPSKCCECFWSQFQFKPFLLYSGFVMSSAHQPTMDFMTEQTWARQAEPLLEEEGEEEEEEEEEEWEYLDETQVYLRFKFYESWLWTDVNLPSKADTDGWVTGARGGHTKFNKNSSCGTTSLFGSDFHQRVSVRMGQERMWRDSVWESIIFNEKKEELK